MELSAFEKLILEAFPIWERNQSPNWGLKKIEMSRSGLLDMMDELQARTLIQTMKARLPEDAAILTNSSGGLKEWDGNGWGSDLYYIIFASAEWEQANQGQEIPSVFIDSWL